MGDETEATSASIHYWCQRVTWLWGLRIKNRKLIVYINDVLSTRVGDGALPHEPRKAKYRMI